MARPFWSGQLRISLVSFGINLIPASESKSEIRFHQIDRQSGERVRHQKVSAVDEEVVEKDDIVKGYEYSKGKYIQLEPAEIAQVRIASRHTIELEQFVKASEIDPAYYEKPWTSNAKVFSTTKEEVTEVIFAPMDEQVFNERIRDTAGGVKK